jgi:DNA-binding transcriptional MocR family regulator
VGLDGFGMRPDELERAVRRGARTVLCTPRAQNPTGAGRDARRAAELRALLRPRRDELFLIEDDHAAGIAGVPLHALFEPAADGDPGRGRWAVVRSMSKALGPDLRTAVLTGDPLTVARVVGRQRLGAGWVSHILQATLHQLWSDPATQALTERAAAAYAERRAALVDALAEEGLSVASRSGLNVWVPVREEETAVRELLGAGWGVSAGERYRIRSGPAIRVTVARLRPEDAAPLARAIARSIRPRVGVRTT